MRYVFLCLMALLSHSPQANAQVDFAAALGQSQPAFLDVEQAFQFDFQQQGQQLIATWKIADGYYLYKQQFKMVSNDASVIMQPLPKGTEKYDEFFGDTEVYYNDVAVTFAIDTAPENAVVKIRYQGCAEAGLCYPPTVKEVFLTEVLGTSAPTTAVSEQFELANLLSSDQALWITLGFFLGLGILLAFTPCVFPMYPILSSVVLGYGKEISTANAFKLSFIYVQGMAITYSLLGLLVASVGAQFQVWLQHPAVLIVMIAIFVAAAAAMFGAYEIQLPSSWQQKLNTISQGQKSGRYAGVFTMGVISGLVASPCTTAPLTGVLLFVAQSGDLILGFSALYALSLGMGIPLIIFAVTGGKLLPKAGQWMTVIKTAFGFMLLAVAIVFIERMVVAPWTFILWVLLLLSLAMYLLSASRGYANQKQKTIFYSMALLVIFSAGYLTVSGVTKDSHEHVAFVKVKDMADFREKLQMANAEGKTVMLDLYADWCVACKEFEHKTFPAANVQEALNNTLLLQVDLTENTPRTQAFWETYNVLGLPTILLFDKQGNEIIDARVTGFMKADPFAAHLEQTFQ